MSSTYGRSESVLFHVLLFDPSIGGVSRFPVFQKVHACSKKNILKLFFAFRLLAKKNLYCHIYQMAHALLS